MFHHVSAYYVWLLHKIDQYGIRGPLHTWLTSFLTERKMRMELEGKYSDVATVDSGVPQVSVLGPILFLYHIEPCVERSSYSILIYFMEEPVVGDCVECFREV
jgi:hypothetical protein